MTVPSVHATLLTLIHIFLEVACNVGVYINSSGVLHSFNQFQVVVVKFDHESTAEAPATEASIEPAEHKESLN
jgi:hypothetical protein